MVTSEKVIDGVRGGVLRQAVLDKIADTNWDPETVAAMAVCKGLCKSHITTKRWLAGDTHGISVETVEGICRFLDIPIVPGP
jgi:hypothetical protein